jgi:hypothetical protein
MAITYDWSFSQFDTAPSKDGLTDVVVVVHWRLTAIDGEYVDSSYGTVTMPDPNPADYVPYDQITKDLTIEWVSGILDVPAIEANLALRIEQQKSPPVVPMVPPFDNSATSE